MRELKLFWNKILAAVSSINWIDLAAMLFCAIIFEWSLSTILGEQYSTVDTIFSLVIIVSTIVIILRKESLSSTSTRIIALVLLVGFYNYVYIPDNMIYGPSVIFYYYFLKKYGLKLFNRFWKK